MDSLKPEEFIHIFIEKVLPGFMEESLSDMPTVASPPVVTSSHM